MTIAKGLDSDFEVIDRYLQIRIELDKLNSELEQIKPIVSEVLELYGRRVKTQYGTVRLTLSARYEYSEAVTKLKNSLDRLRQQERENGIAKIIPIRYPSWVSKSNWK
jgi:hypothetical protein